MKTEEYISILTEQTKDAAQKESVKKSLPLGLDAMGKLVFSQRQERSFNVRHTCVTGHEKSAFVRRLVMSLSTLYKKHEASFFILSTGSEYGELLKLNDADITAPYVRTRADVEEGLECLKNLMLMRKSGEGYPHLFVVLDGLESLPDCNKNGDLEEYRAFLEEVARREDVDVFSSVDLVKSIFNGFPGAFVGIGNCLVTTRGEGRAEVTYVNDDSSMTLPILLEYPFSPSLTETIIYLNALDDRTI